MATIRALYVGGCVEIGSQRVVGASHGIPHDAARRNL